MSVESMVLPERALIVLCGPAGSGKSTFAAELVADKRLATTAIVSSDSCRLMLCDETTSLTAEQWSVLQPSTFELFLTIVGMRLAVGRATIADGVNLHANLRPRLLELARAHHFHSLLIAVTTSVETCLRRNGLRERGRRIPEEQIRAQSQRLQEDLPLLSTEGWDEVIVLERNS